MTIRWDSPHVIRDIPTGKWPARCDRPPPSLYKRPFNLDRHSRAVFYESAMIDAAAGNVVRSVAITRIIRRTAHRATKDRICTEL